MDKILFLLLAFFPAKDANWPSYRGPHGDGHSDASSLPIQWDEQKNVRWKTAVSGKAWASPVVWGNQVWLSNATEKGDKLSAIALDINTGKVIFDIPLFTIEKPMFTLPANSYATPTPVIEEGRVYHHFGSAGTVCLDTKTGKTIWARQDIPCNHHRGPASSPIIFENLLILTFDGFDVQYLIALDKITGKTVWKKDRSIIYGTDNGDNKKRSQLPLYLKLMAKTNWLVLQPLVLFLTILQRVKNCGKFIMAV
jgi:outer membrane protein assembly factor BamB